MSKTYSAGIVTAYGAAKRAGYQGTYEDFCRQQAQYAQNASAIEQAKQTAVSASQSANQAKQDALTARDQAQTAKIQTEQSASQALTDISTARSGAISAVQTEGQTQTANARAQAQAAAQSATTAITKASEASASATTATTKATEAAASATSAAQSAGDAQDVLDSIPADYSDLSANVSQLQANLVTLSDWTGYEPEEITGYFTDAQKAVDSVAGFDRLAYDATNNVLNGSDIRTTSGTGTVGVNFGDFGLTNINSSIDLNEYPIFRFSVESNISPNVDIHFAIWAYTEQGAYVVKSYSITDRTGEIQTLNVKDWFASLGLSERYHIVYIRNILSDSVSIESGTYIKIKLYGFFQDTFQDTTELNPLVDRVTDLETTVQKTESLPYYIGEKSAVNAPLRLHRVLGILGTDGRFTDTSHFVSTVTDKIKCSEGDVFDYYGESADSVVTAQWYAEDYSILSSEKVGNGSYAHQTFTAPPNAFSVIFTSYGTASIYTDYNPGLFVSRAKTYVSPLSGKVWYPCGDSFTAGEFTGISDSIFTSGKYVRKNKTYPYHIGNRTNMDVRRASVSGETISTFDGGTVMFADATYTYGYKSVGIDADYVTLWFGINDAGRSIPIGDIDDTDTTTFYGAWNTVLDDFTTRLLKAHIGIIVSNNLSQTYVDAVIAIAKKWGVPYLDLNYDESVPLMHYSLRPTASSAIKDKRNNQFAILPGTNNHPNLLAHEYESYFIEKWLLSL